MWCKKKIQPGFGPGSSECRSDALTNWATGALALQSRIDGIYISIDTAQFAGWISLRGVFGYFTMLCKDGGLSEAGNELPSWVWYDVHMMIVLGYVPSRGWSESPWRTHRYGEWCYKLPAYWAAPVSLSAVTICVGRHTLWTNWPIREPRLISRQDVKALYDPQLVYYSTVPNVS